MMGNICTNFIFLSIVSIPFFMLKRCYYAPKRCPISPSVRNSFECCPRLDTSGSSYEQYKECICHENHIKWGIKALQAYHVSALCQWGVPILNRVTSLFLVQRDSRARQLFTGKRSAQRVWLERCGNQKLPEPHQKSACSSVLWIVLGPCCYIFFDRSPLH